MENDVTDWSNIACCWNLKGASNNILNLIDVLNSLAKMNNWSILLLKVSDFYIQCVTINIAGIGFCNDINNTLKELGLDKYFCCNREEARYSFEICKNTSKKNINNLWALCKLKGLISDDDK